MRRIAAILLVIAVVGAVSLPYRSYGKSNFLTMKLPNGVSIDIPRNWQVATGDERITIDTTVESQLDLSNLPKATSDLGFVAGYFDDAGDKAKINVRYYPDTKVTQDTVRHASPEGIAKFDDGLREGAAMGFKGSGGTILHWGGTRKQIFGSRTALVTEYRRSPISGEQGPFHVRLIRIVDGSKSFTLTVSYNELYKVVFKPTCDRIVSSLKIE
jgi:hypothetical protein